MAACMLCRRVPRLQYLPGCRKGFAQAQYLHIKSKCETDDQEEKKRVSQQQEFSQGYRLRYNPSSYYHSVCNSANLCSQTDDEDKQLFSPHAPSFWQQSNHYSVSCSRHLSSSKNRLLDLSFNKVPEPERPTVSLYQRTPVPPDVKVDSRAFLKCRPEYASVALDLTQRPQPIEWVEVLPILQKVTIFKDRMKPSDVSQFLMELSKLHPDKVPLVRSDQRFIMLLRYSVENLRLFSHLQLLEVLESFVWLDMPSSHTVLEVYEAELSHRANEMTLHQLLLAADLWRCIGKQVPQFLQNLYDHVYLYLGQIGVSELVQLLYIMGEGRFCPKDLIHPLEQLLMRHLKWLHPEEVGTVCLGLFKSQTSISEGAVTHVVDRALSLVTEMSDFAMVNVLKYLRFSYLFHRGWLEAMAQEVPQRAHRMGVKGLMHVVLTCSALHYRNDSILVAVAERVPSLVPHCRSKDASKLLWAYGSLGFSPVQSPSFYLSLTEALRQKKAEFQRFPEHLLTGLLGLVFVSQFPEDLLALALSPDFVNLALKCTQLDLKRDLLTLDGAVALELPQWTGPRLSCELRQEATEMLWKFAQSDMCQKLEVVEAESALRDLLGGEKFVRKRMILPHTRTIDLEVHLDSAGQPIPVNLPSLEQSPTITPSHQGWEKLNTGVTITDELLAQLINTKGSTDLPLRGKPTSLHRLRPDESERLFDSVLDLTGDLKETLNKPRNSSGRQDSKSTVKIAIQVSSRNHYCSRSQQLLGLHAMKRRHLQLAGFKVVELSYQEWYPILRKSRAEKMAYLHCKIYNSLS
ncbi:FAST kinase domain-containing protein 5, mitochondrial [Melanotaenia boesemani]|uniref:FAST kinase domain-containing protein 5, mitochondrial n=1 Tax=Melanotaenia boesemani TaxID=1250792 RepID=UPI001C05BFA6|nr:FAST kinase domain-containing protein 5, mitochondrial [Melanotaenia boesemani]XP_041858419.1 FAST kinase domain-containing protein 5, mitochondrial [Melanotaenia boesemani]